MLRQLWNTNREYFRKDQFVSHFFLCIRFEGEWKVCILQFEINSKITPAGIKHTEKKLVISQENYITLTIQNLHCSCPLWKKYFLVSMPLCMCRKKPFRTCWLGYDNGLRHERVKRFILPFIVTVHLPLGMALWWDRLLLTKF